MFSWESCLKLERNWRILSHYFDSIVLVDLEQTPIHQPPKQIPKRLLPLPIPVLKSSPVGRISNDTSEQPTIRHSVISVVRTRRFSHTNTNYSPYLTLHLQVETGTIKLRSGRVSWTHIWRNNMPCAGSVSGGFTIRMDCTNIVGRCMRNVSFVLD